MKHLKLFCLLSVSFLMLMSMFFPFITQAATYAHTDVLHTTATDTPVSSRLSVALDDSLLFIDTYGSSNTPYRTYFKSAYLQNGTPVLSGNYDIGFPQGNLPTGVSTGDIDGDGVDDIVVRYRDDVHFSSNERIMVLFSSSRRNLDFPIPNGSGCATPLTSVFYENEPSNVPVIGDINHDGMVDITTIGGCGQLVSFDEDGFVNPGFPYSNSIVQNVAHIILTDINGDGINDLLVSGTYGLSSDKYFLAAIKGDGSEIWTKNYGTVGIHNPAVGDVDGDGTKDIVVSGYDNKLAVLNLQGAESFSATVTGASTLRMADIDGDGKNDIVSYIGNESLGGTKIYAFKLAGSVSLLPNFPVTLTNASLNGSAGILALNLTKTGTGNDIVVPTDKGTFVISHLTGAVIDTIAPTENIGALESTSFKSSTLYLYTRTPTSELYKFTVNGTDATAADQNSTSVFMPNLNTARTGSLPQAPIRQGTALPIFKRGYDLVASDGGLFPFGGTDGYGSTGNVRLAQPVVGMSVTSTGHGYWLVASDGGIFPFGDAVGYGSTGNVHLRKPVVGMARTPSSDGYWLVAADGGIFPFGDAKGGLGSTGNIRLNKPIVGMSSTPSGNGYWLVAADGGIFPFGDAVGYGSTGNINLRQPIVGMSATISGHGYWLVASDGGIFPFGDAVGYGSAGNLRLTQPVVGMNITPTGQGYWLVAADGGIFTYGDARYYGSTGDISLNKPIVGLSN